MSKQLILGSKSPSRLNLLRSAGINPQVVVSHVDEPQILADFWRQNPQPLALAQRARLQVVTLAKAKAQAVVQKLQPSSSYQSGKLVQATTPGQKSPHLQNPFPQQTKQAHRDGERTDKWRFSSQQTEQTSVPVDDVSVVVACDSMLEFAGEILGKPHSPAIARQRWLKLRGNSGVLWTGHALVKLQAGAVVAETAAAESTVIHFGDLLDSEIDAYIATGEPLNVAGAFTLEGLGAPFVERIEGDPSSVIGLSLPLLRRLLQEFGLSITEFWNQSS